MVYGVLFMVYDLWFMVHGVWFIVHGLGEGVYGLGFWEFQVPVQSTVVLTGALGRGVTENHPRTTPGIPENVHTGRGGRISSR